MPQNGWLTDGYGMATLSTKSKAHTQNMAKQERLQLQFKLLRVTDLSSGNLPHL